MLLSEFRCFGRAWVRLRFHAPCLFALLSTLVLAWAGATHAAVNVADVLGQETFSAELHGYEALGIGKIQMKIGKLL